MNQKRSAVFLSGMRDGVPIGLGYFAVAFGLGITARSAGLNVFQGFLISLLNNASAGEYAGLTAIANQTSYLEIALMILIANARYLLMSCALSQKFSPDEPFFHRLIIGFDITDEVFGIGIAYPGYLEPRYMYGAMTVVIPSWALGTAFGVLAGNILPENVVNALCVAIYGMFIAIIIPPARKDKIVAGVVVLSFLLSFILDRLKNVLTLSEGMKTILLTLLIAGGAALLFPRKEEENA